jgi:RecA-family ATPase
MAAPESQWSRYTSCIALGRQWCGLDTERRRVVHVSAEDGADVLHWRVSRIASHLGITLAELEGSLCIIDASQIECELMAEPGRGEEPILTAHYDALGEVMRERSVLILDGASDLYGASEIVRRLVRRFIRALRRVIPADGAALLLAHVDKAAVRDASKSDRYRRLPARRCGRDAHGPNPTSTVRGCESR